MPDSFIRRFWHEVSPTAADSGVEGAPPVLAHDLLECSKTDKNVFRNIVTGDETLVYGYDPKLNNNRHNGRHHHQDPRKRAKFEARQI
jgi:hypothetical protein